MLNRFKNIFIERGFLLAASLSIICLFFFFGKLVVHPNEIYFGSSGDGFQAYYNAIYHVKFDVSYWHFTGQNYPYGEQVFFTGCQPFITNSIKLFSHIIDISGYTVAIMNLTMLFSIVLCGLVIYLIFKHLKLPAVYSAIAATAIAFLSPQIDRLGGHYSLSYEFAIPIFLLLLLKFHSAPSLRKSIVIAVITFFMAGTHLYFYGFFALVSVVYWLGLFLAKELKFAKIGFVAKHFFIQLVLPLLIFQVITFLTDSVTDRTNAPWGFLAFTSNLTGVFFPLGKPYSYLFEYFIKPVAGEWEGWAFIGIVALLAITGIIFIFLKHLVKRNWKKIPTVIDNKVLTLFLIASLLGLFLSFGLPFKIKGCEFLLNYAGLLKQMRGIGRFTWIFFYVINIIACYKIYYWCETRQKVIKYSVLTICLSLLCYDAYTMSRNRQDNFNNSIPVLADNKNVLPENSWLQNFPVQNYQAIIPLPFIHIGSENIWMGSAENEIMKDLFIVSLKTGLPTSMVMMSRTSLSQTYKSIQPFQEPYRPLKIVTDFQSKKPFLILADETQLNENEKNLLSQCSKLYETPKYNVYQLNYNVLQHFSDSEFIKKQTEFNKIKKFNVDGFQSSDSLKTFVYKDYEDLINVKSLNGKGTYEGIFKNYNVLFTGQIPNWKDQEYTISFWMADFTTDLYPRATVELAYSDSTKAIYGTDYFNPGKKLCVLDSSSALIECTFKLREKSDQLTVTIWNDNFTNDKKLFRVDELLIKPKITIIYKNTEGKSITVNNRTYVAKY